MLCKYTISAEFMIAEGVSVRKGRGNLDAPFKQVYAMGEEME
jgi:hypothetical protein